MKKIAKVVAVLIIMIMLSGCGKKKAITTGEFASILGNYQFTVNDATMDLSSDKMTSLLAANNKKYQIEFHVYKNNTYAKEAFKSTKESFMKTATKKSEQREEISDSYEKYALELSDEYKVIARIDNTMIYSSVSLEYKKDLNKMLRKLGY